MPNKQIQTAEDDFYNFVFNTCKNIAEERDSKSMTGVGFLMAVDAINKRHQLEIAQAQQEAVSIKHIREILISKKELHSIIWGETSYEHSGNGVKVLFKGTNKTNPIIKLYVEIDPRLKIVEARGFKKGYEQRQSELEDEVETAEHLTADGWCCACPADVAFMEGKIEKARKEGFEEGRKAERERVLNEVREWIRNSNLLEVDKKYVLQSLKEMEGEK